MGSDEPFGMTTQELKGTPQQVMKTAAAAGQAREKQPYTAAYINTPDHADVKLPDGGTQEVVSKGGRKKLAGKLGLPNEKKSRRS